MASWLAADTMAGRAYRNSTVFTADAQNPVAEAVAIRDSRIVYVGSNEGLIHFILMPGLVDGHLHPLEAGLRLQQCSLNYESLSVEDLQQRVQACLEWTCGLTNVDNSYLRRFP